MGPVSEVVRLAALDETVHGLRRGSPQLGSAALETLVGDICEATHNLPRSLDPFAWRAAAASKPFNKRSAKKLWELYARTAESLFR